MQRLFSHSRLAPMACERQSLASTGSVTHPRTGRGVLCTPWSRLFRWTFSRQGGNFGLDQQLFAQQRARLRQSRLFPVRQCLGVLYVKYLVEGPLRDLWKTQENGLWPPFALGERFGLSRDRFLQWVQDGRLRGCCAWRPCWYGRARQACCARHGQGESVKPLTLCPSLRTPQGGL